MLAHILTFGIRYATKQHHASNIGSKKDFFLLWSLVWIWQKCWRCHDDRRCAEGDQEGMLFLANLYVSFLTIFLTLNLHSFAESLENAAQFLSWKDYHGKSGILKKYNYDASQRIWDPEFFFNEGQRLVKMALSDQLDEALKSCDDNMSKSFFYPLIKGGILGPLATYSLDKVSLERFRFQVCQVLSDKFNSWKFFQVLSSSFFSSEVRFVTFAAMICLLS